MTEISGNASEAGKVIRQSPSGGSKENKGSNVTISVGKKGKKKGKKNGGGTTTPTGP